MTHTNSLGHTASEIDSFVDQFKDIAIENGYSEVDATERAVLLYTGLGLKKFIEWNSGMTDRLDERTEAMESLEEITYQLEKLSSKYKRLKKENAK